MKSILRDYPQFEGHFQFPDFNALQKKCLPKIMKADCNMIVSAPTSSGKTAIFEMAILKYSQELSPICLYLAPIKSLCHEKYVDWNKKFSKNLLVSEVTGDSLEAGKDMLSQSHIAVGTPEKIDFLSRQNLDYLKKIKLLLIDEIHMLNYEQRGATLEAIVSRIMSLNSKVRIIAVSATIPNIQEVGEWLHCPPEAVCVFGEEYRPVKVHKVVAGLPYSGNPFTFERVLNFKLLQAIRTYSEGKGSLIFCPTQKGTLQACEQITNQMRERQFIQNDRQLMALIQAAKQVSNNKLQVMIPQGVAFHNASLSYQDRNIVQRLFLQLKVKVLCTTSTLSMGINLPARLVIIKSTQAYRGSVKGYQEYTRIEIEQMMGRAGRPPFDKEGTVVIMTQKNNYNRYNSQLQLQNLESQLFNHMLEHINAEISLGSILSLSDVQSYFFNSFCYIRMKKSPKFYNINGSVQNFIKESCLKAVRGLADLGIIHFSEETSRVSSRPLSISISKNSVEIRSIAMIAKQVETIETSRQFLMILCKCQEVGKYTSKIEERKTLKAINETNKYHLKEAISNAERKAFVLVQSELSKKHIQFWELRRQASDILVMLRRLNNCVKTLGFQLKNFWIYYWAVKYQKYFSEKFWEAAEKSVLAQLSDNPSFPGSKGGKSLQTHELAFQMKAWMQKDKNFSGAVKRIQHFQSSLRLQILKDQQNGSIALNISALYDFNDKYKGVTICVGDQSNYLYHYKHMNNHYKEVSVHFPKNTRSQYKIGIIKEGIIGFDQFYKLKDDRLVKFDPEQTDLKLSQRRKSLAHPKNQPQLSFKQPKNASLDAPKATRRDRKSVECVGESKDLTIRKLKETDREKQSSSIIMDEAPTRNVVSKFKKPSQLQLPAQYKIRQALRDDSSERKINLQKSIIHNSDGKFRDLKSYNWKPGFQQIQSSSSEYEDQKEQQKQLKLVQSKDKKIGSSFSQFAYKDNRASQIRDFPQSRPFKQKRTEEQELKKSQTQDVFAYFYNLF